jgi:hypothetical protein
MSNALIESPATASQLYFVWSEPDSSPPAAEEIRKEPPAYQPARQINQVETREERLTFSPDGRIAKPVRMGAIMIKLLKRYGITDEEIEEGMADFVARQEQSPGNRVCAAVAS